MCLHCSAAITRVSGGASTSDGRNDARCRDLTNAGAETFNPSGIDACLAKLPEIFAKCTLTQLDVVTTTLALRWTRRLKLFYAAQARGEAETALAALKFILFVNQPNLLSDTYARYLERRIRAAEPYPGLPLLLSCRARSETGDGVLRQTRDR